MPSNLENVCKQIRRDILKMANKSGQSHIGSALCLVEILAVVLFKTMKLDPKKPEDPARDRFILSKGHGAAALYAALAARGICPPACLNGYCVDGGTLHLHPCLRPEWGIETSTGSLGHGLAVAGGIALGNKKNYPKSRTFVLLGDGECNEGSVWEAAAFIAHHKLPVTAIIDANGWQGFGATSTTLDMSLSKIWKAFGWVVVEVDGHDLKKLETELAKARASNEPTVLVAKTIAGKGISGWEHTLDAHYKKLDKEVYEKAMAELS